MNKIKDLSISFLNCNNLKSNIEYAKYLTLTNNISYFNELWLKQNENFILQDIAKITSKKMLFKSIT